MQRRKNELHASFAQLKEECESVIENLNYILEKQKQTIDDVKDMDNENILKNGQWFLKIAKNQHNTLQKVMEMSLDLELYMLQFNKESNMDQSLISVNSTRCQNCNNKDISEDFDKATNKIFEEDDKVIFENENAENSHKKYDIGTNLSNEDNCNNYLSNNSLSKTENIDNSNHLLDEEKSVLSASDDGVSSCMTSESENNASASPQSNNNSSCIASFSSKDNHNKVERIVIKEAEPPKLNDNVLLVSYVNPNEFYINVINENFRKLDEVSKILKDAFIKDKQIFETKGDFKKLVDVYCCFYYREYNNWFRAEIVDWMGENTPNVKIQTLDFGEYYEVSYKNLQVMPDELYSIPKFSVRCGLAYIYPLGSTKNNLLTEWSETATNGFSRYVKENKLEYHIKYMEDEKINNTLMVDLGLDKDGEATMGEYLIKNNLAVEIYTSAVEEPSKSDFIVNQIKTALGMDGISDDMTTSELLDTYFNNTPIVETADTLGEVVTGYDAQDEARICKFRKFCHKSYCRFDHEDVRLDGYTTDKKITRTSNFKNIPFMTSGDKIEISITHVINVNQFYACLLTFDPDGCLKKLVRAMNEPSEIISYKKLKLEPSPGEIIIAKNLEERWYRALVREVDSQADTPDLLVQVFFVDFGDVSMIPLGDCRQMEDKFMNLEFKAVKCYLHNIKPREDVDLDKSKEYFESRFLGRSMTAEIIYPGVSYLDVNVFDHFSTDNANISLELIEEDFAVRIEDSMRPNQTGYLVD